MAQTITLKSSKKTLYIIGPAPSKRGDRFRATDVLEQGSGCQMGSLPGGGNYFSCRRGGGIRGEIKDYVFDPDKHEVK